MKDVVSRGDRVRAGLGHAGESSGRVIAVAGGRGAEGLADDGAVLVVGVGGAVGGAGQTVVVVVAVALLGGAVDLVGRAVAGRVVAPFKRSGGTAGADLLR